MPKITEGQMSVFREYEDLCGFEPMHLDRVRSGELTAEEALKRNQEWLMDVANHVAYLTMPEGKR